MREMTIGEKRAHKLPVGVSSVGHKFGEIKIVIVPELELVGNFAETMANLT